MNVNGQQDIGEPGLAGSTVSLWQCGPDGLAGTADDINTGQSQVTPASGAYLFTNLAPDCYFVTFTTPAGYTPTLVIVGADATDSDSVNGVTGPYVQVSGVPNLTVDAGFYQPTSLGDFVWHDLNRDGQQNGELRPPHQEGEAHRQDPAEKEQLQRTGKAGVVDVAGVALVSIPNSEARRFSFASSVTT